MHSFFLYILQNLNPRLESRRERPASLRCLVHANQRRGPSKGTGIGSAKRPVPSRRGGGVRQENTGHPGLNTLLTCLRPLVNILHGAFFPATWDRLVLYDTTLCKGLGENEGSLSLLPVDEDAPEKS